MPPVSGSLRHSRGSHMPWEERPRRSQLAQKATRSYGKEAGHSSAARGG